MHCCDLFFPSKKGSHYFDSMNTLEAILANIQDDAFHERKDHLNTKLTLMNCCTSDYGNSGRGIFKGGIQN